MRFETISLEAHGQVTRIALNRIPVLNALNRLCLSELHNALEDTCNDTESRVILITGSGDRAFTVGADINDLATLVHTGDRSGIQEFSALFETLFRRLESVDKLTIAAVNGPAVGGGAELALACDVRLLSTKAYFSFPEILIGLIPPTFRLKRLLPQSCVSQFVLTGEKISAERAKQMGLALEVFQDNEFHDKVMSIASELSKIDPRVIKTTKGAIRGQARMDPAYENPMLFFSDRFKQVLQEFMNRGKKG